MFQTINGWTKQRMKEAIRAGNNGEQSWQDDKGCLYRTSDGNKCAVGCFIPDELYTLEMDDMNADGNSLLQGSGAYKIVNQFDLLKYMPINVSGLEKMQGAHDCADLRKVPDMRDYLSEWIDQNVEESEGT